MASSSHVFLNPVFQSGSLSGHPMNLCLYPFVFYFRSATSQVRTLYPAEYCVTRPTLTASSPWAGFVSKGPQCLARCQAKVTLAVCP